MPCRIASLKVEAEAPFGRLFCIPCVCVVKKERIMLHVPACCPLLKEREKTPYMQNSLELLGLFKTADETREDAKFWTIMFLPPFGVKKNEEGCSLKFKHGQEASSDPWRAQKMQ